MPEGTSSERQENASRNLLVLLLFILLLPRLLPHISKRAACTDSKSQGVVSAVGRLKKPLVKKIDINKI